MESSNFKNYYQFIGESCNGFTKGKWYLRVGDIDKPWAFIDDDKFKNGMCPDNHLFFDINNPKDFLPKQP